MTINSRKRIIILTVLWISGALLAPGCGGPTSVDTKPGVEMSEASSDDGAIRLTAEVKPSPATLADRIELTVTINHEPNIETNLPEFPEQMGHFRVGEMTVLPRNIDEERVVQQAVVELEPLKTGKLEIFPVVIEYTERPQPTPVTTAVVDDGTANSEATDDNAGQDPDADSTLVAAKPVAETAPTEMKLLETEPIFIEVGTVVEGEDAELSNLREESPPVEIADPWRYAYAAAATIVALAIVIIVGRMIARRKKAGPAVIILTPEEVAREELRKLRESGLAQTDVKQCYVELTAIVRRYIEAVTAIRAPEQTTEEFLRQITTESTFSNETTRRLQYFLEAADLVKFAAQQPREEDVDESFLRADEFIESLGPEVAASYGCEEIEI